MYLDRRTVFQLDKDIEASQGIAISKGGFSDINTAERYFRTVSYHIEMVVNDKVTSYALPVAEERRLRTYFYERPDSKYEMVWEIPNESGILKQIALCGFFLQDNDFALFHETGLARAYNRSGGTFYFTVELPDRRVLQDNVKRAILSAYWVPGGV